MSTHKITNKTSSMLGMAPLKDLAGLVITLKPEGKEGDTVEIDDETLGNPVCQRVLGMKWIVVSQGAQGVVPAVSVAPTVDVPAAVVAAAVAEATKTEAPAVAVEEMPAAVVEEPVVIEETPERVVPVEGPTSSETPMRSSRETSSPKNKK